ncbi:alpha/beta fold hydrolase [Altererythrobacter salegens]|uniref:Alpha/beta fold hydrolase n=1 Tax=Croceibacterium salegens TaxID=1737568 RepID=A0A6I4T1Z3_9SPHN|nr:alpha/beta hydrolase [Croceibacterium salegens]MXO60652.1 alpha/beta fold hydrolase [Croceibacterium salegens]
MIKKKVDANNLSIAYFEAGRGAPVVLLHGFPELAYSWRSQIAALAAKGWQTIAPDLRGYGDTGPVGDLAAYSMRNLALDVIGLLDSLEIAQAVIVGHDFGGMLAWWIAREHSDRVLGVASLNTPYTHRGTVDLAETMRRYRGEDNYMVRFQVPGEGERLLEADVAATFRGLMRRSSLTLAEFDSAPAHLRCLPMTLFVGEPEVMGEPIMSEAELQVYIDAFSRNGFAGPLNWYRNLHRNWLDSEGTTDLIDVPALMISAADDFFLPPATTIGMERYVRRLERHVIADCGHWTQHERPGELNALLLGWLDRSGWQSLDPSPRPLDLF